MTASSKSQSPNAVRSISSTVMDEDRKNDAKETTVDETELLSVHETRSLILRLSVLVGNLCSLFLQSIPLDGGSVSTTGGAGAVTQTLQDTPGIQICMAELLSGLMCTAASVSINLETAILKKMELNGKKYPVHLCKGKAGKYTDYSVETGITKDGGQSTLEVDTADTADTTDGSIQTKEAQRVPSVDFVDALPGLQEYIRTFATARKWTDFHLPRSLLLALMGELGELAELFQWKQDSEQTLSLQEHDKIGQEVSDVSIYLIRLADVCGVSLKDAMLTLRQGQDVETTAATTTD